VLHCHLTARPNSRSRTPLLTRDRLCGAIGPSAAAYQISAQYGKFAGPLVGPLFVGAPIQPNMLNMPKSASVRSASTSVNSRKPDAHSARTSTVIAY